MDKYGDDFFKNLIRIIKLAEEKLKEKQQPAEILSNETWVITEPEDACQNLMRNNRKLKK